MATMPGIAPPHPIPIKDRASVLFIEKGRLDVLDGAFVVVDRNGVRTHIPVGGLACLMLEPGARVSHAAVALAARVGCLLVWVGEAGVPPLFGWSAGGSPRGSPSSSGAACARSRRPSQDRSQDVRHAFRRACSTAPVRRSAPGDRGSACKASVRGAGPAARSEVEGAAVRPRALASRGSAQSLPQPSHRVPLRSGGSRRSRRGICPGHRISAHRQASVIRLRCGRCVQVRNRGSDSVSGSGAGAAWKAARGWRSGG